MYMSLRMLSPVRVRPCRPSEALVRGVTAEVRARATARVLADPAVTSLADVQKHFKAIQVSPRPGAEGPLRV